MAQVTSAQCVELKTNPGFRLAKDAAAAWDRACAEFGKQVIITGAWRSYETQERIFKERYVQGNHAGKAGYTTDVRKWNGVQYTRKAGTAAAAVPGTSNHGAGQAVDVKTKRAATDPAHAKAVVFTGWNDVDRIAFLKVSAKHGLLDTEGRSVNEHWHITYYPAKDTKKAAAPPVTSVPAPAPAPASATLQRGSKGAGVKRLQEGLNKVFPSYKSCKGGNGKLLVADSDFGAVTEAWVKHYQTKTGLVPDGVVGAKTIAKLKTHGIYL